MSATINQSVSSAGKLHIDVTHEVNGKTYLLSSSYSRLDHTAINSALASPELFWARSLSSEHLSTMLENSFCLGLYVLDDSRTATTIDNSPGRQIGLARLITDHVTFAWLTDVYVLSAYQRQGLGRWMITMLNQLLDDMPELRRAMLIAHVGRTSAEYQKVMGCETWENGTSICMQKRGPAGGSLGIKSEATNE